jgi:hypothetical protein
LDAFYLAIVTPYAISLVIPSDGEPAGKRFSFSMAARNSWMQLALSGSILFKIGRNEASISVER